MSAERIIGRVETVSKQLDSVTSALSNLSQLCERLMMDMVVLREMAQALDNRIKDIESRE